VTRRAGFVLDLGRCTGCAACVLACRLEYGWPGSAPRRRVLPLNEVRHPAGPTYFLSVACHHCERPACAAACPTGAYERRADGIVRHREDLCVGCRYCEMACPFGAPRFDEARGVVAKCDFCEARFERREAPACVAACPTEALRVAWDSGPAVDVIPGFRDAAGCVPSVRFALPGGIRGARLTALLRRMTERG
jgi:Fe-S-cluster-containing dehydrogenase component